MGWIGCFCCEMFMPRSRVRIFRNECTRSTPLDPKLMIWCVSYHRVCSLRKIPMRLRGTNFSTSSEHFAPSFVRQLSGPKCTQMVPNTTKHEFRVQWGGSRAFVAKNSDATSWHEHFATKAPDPPHWTLNSCFGAFRTIWVHLEPLGCLTKLGAKRAELVQKFMPRSRVRI